MGGALVLAALAFLVAALSFTWGAALAGLCLCLLLVGYATQRVKANFAAALMMFFMLYFGVVPYLQLLTNSTMYLDPVDPNGSAVVLWYLLVFSFLAVFWASLRVYDFKLHTELLSRPRSSELAYAYLGLCAAAYLFFFAKFGSVAAMFELYDQRVTEGVGDFNPLKGLGVVQAFANAFPLILFVLLVARIKHPSLGKFLLLTLLTLALGFVVSAAFGSRQGVVFLAWGCFWIWHRTVNNFSRKFIVNSVLVSVLLMLIMMPLKFFGTSFTFDMISEFNEIRGIDAFGGPLGFALFRDFGRFDIQIELVGKMLAGEVDYAYGKTLLGGLLSPVPNAIFDASQLSPTLLKTMVLYGAGWYNQDYTTLLSGLPGEFLMNYSYVGYMLFGLLLAALVYLLRILNRRTQAKPGLVYFEVFLLPLIFLIFLFDSNVIGYYLFRWIVVFSVPMYLLSRNAAGAAAVSTGVVAPGGSQPALSAERLG